VLETFTDNLQVGLLVLFRILAMLQVVPLMSSSAVPQIAKIGLALFVTFAILPWVLDNGYPLPSTGLEYGLLLLGEALLGILTGFVVFLVFSTFQVAGQFFSLQMGFGAAQVFDPLAQIQIPLLGQFFNLMAMFVFLTMAGFHKIMLVGVFNSFQAVRAVDLATGQEAIFSILIASIGRLLQTALTLSLPILGSLLLVAIGQGMLAKAAPQMNLLIVGFPISIGAGLLIFVLTLPLILEATVGIIDGAFEDLQKVLGGLRGVPIPGTRTSLP
jgi:flagellar biosynthetic protein FliR